jgi:hypothetical protein
MKIAFCMKDPASGPLRGTVEGNFYAGSPIRRQSLVGDCSIHRYLWINGDSFVTIKRKKMSYSINQKNQRM